MSNWRRPLLYVLTVVVILAVWELLSVSGLVQPLLLASPADTWTQLRGLAGQGSVVGDALQVTLRETLIAFGIAVVIGVPLGLALGSSRLLRKAYEPVLTSLNALPLVILYPVLAATLGIGSASKIALAALYAFFPIAIATVRATSSVDPRLVTAARTMGASQRQLTLSVIAPSVSSPVLAGLRVGLGLALVTTIAAEFISGSMGVGYQLGATSQGLDTPGLFAWIVVACLLTIAVNLVFTLCTTAARKGIYR
jgi:NitT/TauT family transport system permease protein